MFWHKDRPLVPGDTVQRVVWGQTLSPYVGEVTLVRSDHAHVRWPFCMTAQCSNAELVHVGAEFQKFLPPNLHQPGLRVASLGKWRRDLPPHFHATLARRFHEGFSELKAYDQLWQRHNLTASDEAIRGEIQTFFRFASKSWELFKQTLGSAELEQKTAAYWFARDRTYRATRSEIQAGCPNCPKCHTPMHRTTYKMSEGARVRLFACPADLTLLKENSIVGPGGEPVVWGCGG